MKDFIMANFNKVTLSSQKIKELLNYLVQDFSFSNNEAEILIVDTIKANAHKSVTFNGETSYRIVKTDNVSDATVSFPDTREETPQDIATELASQQEILRQTPYEMNKK